MIKAEFNAKESFLPLKFRNPHFVFLFKSKLLNNNVRDYTDVETPCSISNQEAKHIVGDDTTPYWQGESSSLRTLFFLFLKI